MRSHANLVPTLDALLQTSSVSKAARRVGLSQSAVSHALTRLREVFDDPLLHRTGRRMALTPKAMELAPRAREVAAGMERLFVADPAGLKLDRLQRTFHIHIPEAVLFAIGPALHAATIAQAPLVDVHIESLAHDRVVEALHDGALDLAIDAFPEREGNLDAHPLFRDRLVCVVRSDHPVVDAGLSIEQFAELPHVRIASPGWAGEKHALDVLDGLLVARGRTRRIVCSVPHALAACRFVAGADSIVTTSRCLATAAAAFFDVQIVELPLRIPPYALDLVWPTRKTPDQAHRWLREQIVGAAPLKVLVAKKR